MQRLGETTAISFAKEFTSLAIQNDLIPRNASVEENAEDVAIFFNTILDKITTEQK